MGGAQRCTRVIGWVLDEHGYAISSTHVRRASVGSHREETRHSRMSYRAPQEPRNRVISFRRNEQGFSHHGIPLSGVRHHGRGVRIARWHARRDSGDENRGVSTVLVRVSKGAVAAQSSAARPPKQKVTKRPKT